MPQVVLVCFCFLFFCACSVDVHIPPAELVILDKNSLSKEQNILSGTGRVVFNQPLFGLFSKEFYFINVELINEDSFLILHSHFTNFVKEDGIKVFFKKVKTKLLVSVSTPSYPVQLLYEQENYFKQNNNLNIHVEIQNGGDHFIHVKIWDSIINPTGYLKKEVDFFSSQNLIADSHDLMFYSRGHGLLWGVELHNARLLKIERRSIAQ